MILILMQSRSGSSLVASIFAAHGYNTNHTRHVNQFKYLDFEHEPVKRWLIQKKEAMNYQQCRFVDWIPGIEKQIQPNDCVKVGVEYWPLFEELQPKVFCVRRDPEQIAKSLEAKRTERNRQLMSSQEMWRSVRKREKMLNIARDESGGVDINVQLIIDGYFGQLNAAFQHHGLTLDTQKAAACVRHQKWHQR